MRFVRRLLHRLNDPETLPFWSPVALDPLGFYAIVRAKEDEALRAWHTRSSALKTDAVSRDAKPVLVERDQRGIATS